MGQHQAKVDNSGPSPPPIFGYEPGYGAYPLGNPPKEVLAIQNSRKNGQAPPSFAQDKLSPPFAPQENIPPTFSQEVFPPAFTQDKMPLMPGGFMFPPFHGRPMIPVDVSAFLANAPPFPKSPDQKKKEIKPTKVTAGQSDDCIDIDFDIAEISDFTRQEVPCDPAMKMEKNKIVKNDKPSNFFMRSLLSTSSNISTLPENIPSDPIESASVSLADTQPFQGTYYDEPANESTQPPPLPPRMTSLATKTFFNPFGVLPTPNVDETTKCASVIATDAEEVFRTNIGDNRTERDIVILLASLIRLMPVLWSPKFSTKLEVQQVEDAWEKVGTKVGCSNVWPLQRLKIVWLTNVAKFKKSVYDKSFPFYKDMEFLLPVMKVKSEISTPVRIAGRKSSSTTTFMQEYEDDYIPPQKIRNIALAGI